MAGEQKLEARPGENKAATAKDQPPTRIVPQTEKPATEKPKPAEAEAQPMLPGGEALARQQFAAGDFRTAGNSWRAAIRSAQIKFSILLEMDCLKESVQGAYSQLADRDDFFLLNRTSRDGRSCWLVLWGRYRTADEAALGLKLVPQYFWQQSEPPSVVELEPYLR